VLQKFEIPDIVQLVTQYPDSPTRCLEPRLVWLVKTLQLAVQDAEDLLVQLKSTTLHTKAKLRKNFDSSLLITIEDENERNRQPQGRVELPLFDSMLEDAKSPTTVLIEDPRQPRGNQDGLSDNPVYEPHKTQASSRKRSSLHKQLKNERQAVNRKKQLLLQQLNLQ